jgi:ElaB/YqjD/DUF883 family membrane-anchored ribosome-binding protein
MDTNIELKRTIKHQFRSVRRYIRANPEKGVMTSFMGGMLLGMLIGKIISE